MVLLTTCVIRLDRQNYQIMKHVLFSWVMRKTKR